MTKIDERSPPVAIGSEERRALRSYFAEQPEVIASYLFGSQVSGRPGPLSDVDLAVWLDSSIDPADRWRRQHALMSGAAAALRTDEVDVVILNDAPPLLAQRVLRERILLTERDAAGRVGLETAAVVEYLDTAPLREELGRALSDRVETGTFVDREAIEQRLARLEREIRMVAALREEGRDRFLADEGLQHQAERALQVSIQICIDIAAHLVAALALRAPDGYRELFDRLADEASLDSRLAVRLEEAVGQRNLLVHAYLDSDPAGVWEKLEEVGDLRAYARWALEQESA